MPWIIISMEAIHLYGKDHGTTGVRVKKRANSLACFVTTSSTYFWWKVYFISIFTTTFTAEVIDLPPSPVSKLFPICFQSFFFLGQQGIPYFVYIVLLIIFMHVEKILVLCKTKSFWKLYLAWMRNTMTAYMYWKRLLAPRCNDIHLKLIRHSYLKKPQYILVFLGCM